METIRAVLLDVDNTLLDFDKCAAAVIRTLFVEEGLPFSDGTLADKQRFMEGDRTGDPHQGSAAPNPLGSDF